VLTGNPFDTHVIARLLDFFDARTPWSRRLWTLGSIYTLEEALRLQRQAGVYEGPRRRARQSARELAVKDQGMGPGPERGRLDQLLKLKEVRDGSPELIGLDMLLEAARDGYLSRWADALRTTTGSPYGPERTARHLAAHLLDAGISPSRLHQWWRNKARTDPVPYALPDLVEQVDADLLQHRERVELLVLFTKYSVHDYPPGWIAPGDVSAWFGAHGHRAAIMDGRHVGGMQLTEEAFDRDAAISMMRERIERYTSRLTIGAHADERFEIHPGIWANGGFHTKLEGRRQGEVRSLSRTSRLFAEPQSGDSMDAALELIALLHRGTSSAAAAAAWAAIENVLKTATDPGAHLAAARLGDIIACSWPRAELSTLAARRRRYGDALASQLDALPLLRDKAKLVAHHLRAGTIGLWRDAADEAGAARMIALFNDPYGILSTVSSYTSQTLVRLYRERNSVMHGGQVEREGLRASLRVAEPLVGAGFDRLAHATFVREVTPMRLAAQAATGIELSRHRGPEDLCDLLE
jgi:hypothetical protein